MIRSASECLRARVLEALVDRCLNDDNWDLRLSAANTIGRLAPLDSASESSFSNSPLETLFDRCMNCGLWQHQLAKMLESLLPAVTAANARAVSDHLKVLIDRLTDEDRGVRYEAIDSLQTLAPVVVSVSASLQSEVVEALIDRCLNDDGPYHRDKAAEALGLLASVIASVKASLRSKTVEAIVDRCLSSSDRWVRDEGALTLGRLAPVIATVKAPLRSRAIEALFDRCLLLGYPGWWVGDEAEAFGRLAPVIASVRASLRYRILAVPIERCYGRLMKYDNNPPEKRREAAKLPASLEPVVASMSTSTQGHVFDALIHHLWYDQMETGWRADATEVMGTLAPVIAAAEAPLRKEVLGLLFAWYPVNKWWSHPYYRVREHEGIRLRSSNPSHWPPPVELALLGKFQILGMRFFAKPSGPEHVLTVQELGSLDPLGRASDRAEV